MKDRVGLPMLICMFSAIISLSAVATQVGRVATAIQQQSSFYLCVEAWKMGSKPDHCEDILNKRGR